MYHDICDNAETSGFPGGDAALYKISVSDFKEQMSMIAAIPDRNPSIVANLDIANPDIELDNI